MDSQFWIKAWNEGRTAFHQQEYHEKLTQYFPQLNPKAGERVLVPLCGKSKDLLWLSKLNLQVHGVELHEQAVQSFFEENKLSSVKTQDPGFINYTHENILISCGDFFKLNANATYDFVYDRAALVALPLAMRKNYSEVITQALKKGGKVLLIAYEYDQSKMEGPPFSVGTEEIHAIYEKHFTIKPVDSSDVTKEGPRLSSVAGLKQNVYILEKTY